jgi:hypothetical protein
MLKLINGSLTGGVNYEEVYMVTEDDQKKILQMTIKLQI